MGMLSYKPKSFRGYVKRTGEIKTGLRILKVEPQRVERKR